MFGENDLIKYFDSRFLSKKPEFLISQPFHNILTFLRLLKIFHWTGHPNCSKVAQVAPVILLEVSLFWIVLLPIDCYGFFIFFSSNGAVAMARANVSCVTEEPENPNHLQSYDYISQALITPFTFCCNIIIHTNCLT